MSFGAGLPLLTSHLSSEVTLWKRACRPRTSFVKNTSRSQTVLKRSAILSGDKKFRYLLRREWGTAPNMPVLWVMLNPSTADADVDDATVRKCMGFTDRWGYKQMEVVNLYAYRATNPRDLSKVGYPVGPENAAHIRAAAERCAFAIIAWGQNALKDQAKATVDMLREVLPGRLYALGYTETGAPRHPLYLRYESARLPVRGFFMEGP